MARKIQALLAAARPLYARGGEAVGGAIVRLPEVLFFLTGCRIRTVKTLRACLSIWPWRFAQQSGATDAYSKTWLRLRGARLIEICLFEFPFRAAAGRQTAPSPHWSSSLCPPRTPYACNAHCPHGHINGIGVGARVRCRGDYHPVTIEVDAARRRHAPGQTDRVSPLHPIPGIGVGVAVGVGVGGGSRDANVEKYEPR
jgi:hypothetical protein